jgi:hypothetical protein
MCGVLKSQEPKEPDGDGAALGPEHGECGVVGAHDFESKRMAADELGSP